MGIASSKQLNDALVKAKGLGLVEERVTIHDCEIVLRNLRPDQYEAVVEETKELEDLKYLDAWQVGHVARAIVELNGVDFRDVEYVEVEEPDPKDKSRTRTVKRELHDWVTRYVLASWSKEAVFSIYRKFCDVVFLAEKKAVEGVHFIIAEETGEEKYRRLLGEVKELEAEVPPALVRSILLEKGYTLSTQEEDHKAVRGLEERLQSEEAPAATEGAPVTAAPPAAHQTAPETTDLGVRAARFMRERVPVHQQTVVNQPKVPDASTPIITPPPRTAEIAAEIAAEPGALDQEQVRASVPQAVVPPGMAPHQNVPSEAMASPPVEKPILSRQGASHTDPRQMASILNTRPTGVMNPKFRPPSQAR